MLGNQPWGMHVCQFFSTKDDLFEILVPYFIAGLENNEFCMWVTASPLDVEDAAAAMRYAMPDFQNRLDNGQMEIVPHDTWYLKGGTFELRRVMSDWLKKLDAALAAGYEGIRVTGNTAWLERKDWGSFEHYEAELNKIIGGYRILAVCSYSLEECTASDVVDVVANHRYAITKRSGQWSVIESSTHKVEDDMLRAEKVALSERIKAGEARFRAMVETTADWVWETDASMTYTYTSPRVFDLLGYTPEELSGKSFLDLMPPEDQRRFKEFFGPIAASKSPFFLFEHTKLSKDGSPIVFESTGVPVLDDAGNLLGYRGIGRNVTERKRLENIWQARLRIVEFASSHPMDDLLQKTLDELEKLTGSSIGFYHFLEADQNTLSLQNWSTNTLKTMCTAEGKGLHYNISDAGVWVDCIHQRRPVIHNNYTSLPHRKGMPEGHAPVVRELVVPIFRGSNIVAIIGVGNKQRDYDDKDISIVSQIGDVSWDIVEYKRAEEALKLYQGNLEELVAKRTEQLEAANTRLKELDRLKSLFIASMSHELRTPLNTIIGFTGIILQGMTGEINAEQRKQLTMVLDSSHHLLDLINDVIDISKIEAGKVDLSIEWFDMIPLVKKTVEPFIPLAKTKGIKLSMALPESLIIESDARRIRQVMVNLLGNAIKFTDSGNINVHITEADTLVNIVVTDTGIGINEMNMGKLFESFSQIVVNGRPKEGSGLGLYLTRKITHLLGGEVKVESTPGMGSAFTVTLPMKYERR